MSGSLRRVWISGLTVAAMTLSTAASGAPTHCAPCSDVPAESCCDHGEEQPPPAHDVRDEQSHCECQPDDCTPRVGDDATLPSVETELASAERRADRSDFASYHYAPPVACRSARAPPPRTVVLLL